MMFMVFDIFSDKLLCLVQVVEKKDKIIVAD